MCQVLTFIISGFWYTSGMKKKIKVGIIFGGKSAEHEVSLQSAKNVIDALDKDKYEPVLIGIDKKGTWHLQDKSDFLLNSSNPKLITLNKRSELIATVPDKQNQSIVVLSQDRKQEKIDVVIPILHGPFGEDGTIQGLLKLMDLPFVGSSVLGSAIGMDKEVTKKLLRDAGIPIGKFLTITDPKQINFAKAKKALGLPMFIKPANMGSSVGVSKVKNEKEFYTAIELAFQYDLKVIVEEMIKGREIECSVLGNDDPIASIPGEIIVRSEFYSYEAKYIDENGAKLAIPAELPKETVKKVQTIAVAAFKALCLQGMARVDFFLRPNGDVLVNEANTIPGFTKISMYPKLWEASGISYTKLIDKLIELAIDRYQKEKNLKTSY